MFIYKRRKKNLLFSPQCLNIIAVVIVGGEEFDVIY